MKRKVDMIVIHCSASKASVNYTFDQCVKDHKARGFKQCGYHRFIAKDGTIHIGRNFDYLGAHVEGYNAKSIGICYEGGLDEKSTSKKSIAKDTRTEAQKASILKCIKEAMEYGNITRIIGHRDLSPDLNGNGIVEPHEWVKVCPSFDAVAEYKHLLK